jgi:hypothetical protein
MTVAELVQSQLTDPFRIVFVAGLLLTALRTRAQTGLALPLAVGAAFIAAIIPLTTQAGAGVPFPRAFAAGIVANAVLLAAALALWQLLARLRGG